ncbi:MAG TPA: glycosyltransferase [Candidatus Udaeobacter sp.]|nr:glycosyltransferase [Candidatus Udaeobacter sp.]
MLPLIIVAVVLLIALCVTWLLPGVRKRRHQVRFIRATLAGARKFDRRVIVSLSTVPDRVDNLRPTIDSLLKQTRLPDEIVLAIPEFSIREQRPYIVPEYISRLPRVRILRCSMDWGPATKFIPAIQDELVTGRENTLIMVVDDDRIYPRDALETYLFYSRQLPNAALCFRGAAMPRTLDWDDAKMIKAKDLREPRPVAVITGCGSYLVQPRFFDQSLWDYSKAPAIAFYIDDIWISAWLSRRGVKRYVVPASAMMRSVRRQRGSVSLNQIPGRQKMNNETIAFFKDAWDVFASP